MTGRAQLLFLVLALGHYVTAYSAQKIDDLDRLNNSVSSNPSVLTLYCQVEGQHYYQSKLALLQNEATAKYDVGITTAHGLIGKEGDILSQCMVKDFSGATHEILEVTLADGYEPGTASDWALLKMHKVKSNAVVRFSLPEFSDNQLNNIKNESIKITFPKGRGLGFNTQNCLSLPALYTGLRQSNLMAHNCRSISGQSGSPVAVSLNEINILMGIHLGESFILHSPISKKPERLGFYRLIDNDMVVEIQAKTMSLNSEP